MKESKNQLHPYLSHMLREERSRPKLPSPAVQKTPAVYTRAVIKAARMSATSAPTIGLAYSRGKLQIINRRNASAGAQT